MLRYYLRVKARQNREGNVIKSELINRLHGKRPRDPEAEMMIRLPAVIVSRLAPEIPSSANSATICQPCRSLLAGADPQIECNSPRSLPSSHHERDPSGEYGKYTGSFARARTRAVR
jgi:hypothetical protein